MAISFVLMQYVSNEASSLKLTFQLSQIRASVVSSKLDYKHTWCCLRLLVQRSTDLARVAVENFSHSLTHSSQEPR